MTTSAGKRRPAGASKTEWVYRELRNRIIVGQIPSGAQLFENPLAAEMEVSRTPIREALHKLAMEGLVQAIPRAGYIVESLSEADIHDLYATRTAIEQISARWALDRITPRELELLERNLEETERIISTGRTRKMIDLDREFHLIICQAAKSKKMYYLSQLLSDQTLKFRIACIHVPEVAERAGAGHRSIVEAIRAKDPALVDETIQVHLETAKRDILDYLERARLESLREGERLALM
ncbi:MAG: GntR family transcriptional regulator [Deltaproteobacteria bacterium]